MPKKTKKTKKVSTTKPIVKKSKSSPAKKPVVERLKALWQRFVAARKNFLRRRPHRSFRLSRRSQTSRSLKIEGYINFSINVWREMKKGKKFFAKLFVLLIVLFAVLSLTMPQTSYNNLRDALNETIQEADIGGSVYRAGLLFMSSVNSSGLTPASDQSGQMLNGLIIILTWLAVVYYLRHQLVGKEITLRDVVYNSSAPLVSTIIVLVFALIQLVPFGMFMIIYSAAKNTEVINGGVGEMLAVLSGVLIVALTLYWLVSTLIALSIVTVSGTEPIKALRLADDIVVGRRSRIVRRVLWHSIQVFMVWVVVLMPIILLENSLSNKWSWIADVPVVPIAMAILLSATIVWTSAYLYILYRKILDDKSRPA